MIIQLYTRDGEPDGLYETKIEEFDTVRHIFKKAFKKSVIRNDRELADVRLSNAGIKRIYVDCEINLKK